MVVEGFGYITAFKSDVSHCLHLAIVHILSEDQRSFTRCCTVLQGLRRITRILQTIPAILRVSFVAFTLCMRIILMHLELLTIRSMSNNEF